MKSKSLLKAIGGYTFSTTLKAWYIEYSDENLSASQDCFAA